MKKYICTRGWQRNSTGDVIEEWQFNKYPEEVKERNFKEYLPEPEKPVKKESVVEKPQPTPPIKTETSSKFKPFSISDDIKEV